MLKAPIRLAGYCPEAKQFFSRTGDLSSERKYQYDRLIRTLVANNIWSKLDIFYIFAAPSEATALTNLPSSSFSATANGSPTFAADLGYTGTDSSTTVYIDLGYNPSTQAISYSQNSAHISAWSNTTAASVGANSGIIVGINSSNPALHIFPKYNDGKAYFRTNDGTTSAGISQADARGFYVGTRSASGTQQGYKNGVDQGVVSQTSQAIASRNVYALATNGGATATFGAPQQTMAVSVGGLLTASQVLIYYNALHIFLQNVSGISY